MEPRRAAGAVLRGVRRRGELLRPALAIEALLAAMRARFDLDEAAADQLLRPALADWRDAVGCADPLLVPANAATEKHLVPLPIPSWCTWLVEEGVLRLDAPAAVEGPRVVQPASLLVVREAELSAVERFPLLFAGRFGSGAASLSVHLAISPPFRSPAWHGSVCLRAAARRSDGQGAPIWLGPPAAPSGGPIGASDETVATWVSSDWPRWAVLRVLEGREPQALWDLRVLLDEPGEIVAGPAGAMRLGVDIGSTATVVVEEDSAVAGSVGAKLLRSARSSGFRRLAGDPLTAHQVGCAEQLLAPGGQLPTALVASGPEALLRAGDAERFWLPQAPPADAPATEAGLLVDRFKSPELLLLSDWLGELPDLDRAQMSRSLLRTYAYLLGRTLAAAHGAPLITPEGGRWTLRLPRLGAAEATLTYPQCAFDAAGSEPFSRVFDEVGRELCRGLGAAWASASHRMVADPTAARAARSEDARRPLEVFADFGGLTLQITVRVPHAPVRPAPFIPGSSMSYLLGGERLIDAAAFAESGAERESYRALARRFRALIAGGGHLEEREPATGEAILETVLALVRRQLEGTLRRAVPDSTTLRGAGVRLYLLGDGWKLISLDVPEDARERETVRRIEERLTSRPLLPGALLQLERMDKRRVCEGALRTHAASEISEDAVELQGVDVASAEGLRQRWFGLAGSLEEPDLSPSPHDPWWREFAGEDPSLLRMEQWFSAPAPFQTRLSGGNLAFDARRSFLKQWLDLSGPSLVALRIHSALRP
jgi:hypothetical protein